MKLPGSPWKPTVSQSSSSTETAKPWPALCSKMALTCSMRIWDARRGMRPQTRGGSTVYLLLSSSCRAPHLACKHVLAALHDAHDSDMTTSTDLMGARQ